MGFPNIDIYMVKQILDKFAAIKTDDGFAINDTFDDLDEGYRAEIIAYVNRKAFTSDLRVRNDNQVYVLPHFPLIDMPLPQIGISLGQESTSEKFLNDLLGDSAPVYDENGTQTHWDIPKGYVGSALYRIDVVTSTKDEAIWLSRLIQRFICEEQVTLSDLGVYEIDITLADLKLEQEHLPQTVFNRAVQINCKVQNTWVKRIPVNSYQSGNNKGQL